MFKLFDKKVEVRKDEFLNEVYAKLKEYTHFNELTEDRKKQLRSIVEKYGYLNYPHLKALEELSAAETLCALEVKWENNGIFKDGNFCFENNQVSPLARNNIKNADWLKKEGHDIKLINLAALGNGNYSETPGKFFDWVKQILILPTGNLKRNIFNTTIYLIPFQPRDFGCAYLPTSSDVSPNLNDENIEKTLNYNVKEQVQLFIEFAQLAGHPVIYDVLPQAGRFEKVVLANPQVARWYNINELIQKICAKVDELELKGEYSKEDINIAKDLYKQILKSGAGEISTTYKEICDEINEELVEFRKQISNEMSEKKSQEKLVKQVKEIVANTLKVKPTKHLEEQDITDSGVVINALTSAGLWTICGGAWCSAGVPVFYKMSECGGYPIFKHYDVDGKDVTSLANLDCQTPYYFVYLENGKFNKPVIDFYIKHLEQFQAEYGFDGFRVDHVDHVVDKVSATNGVPISYRAPSYVLGELNKHMKAKIPYFATLAEYMLWDKYYKEYHEDMHFDVLWGNDIPCQSEKTPETITEDNQELTNYNVGLKSKNYVSVLKTYNNQDGEFPVFDRYPTQLGENGAIFKWFKYKFLSGGKFANRPVLYVDGDESFTQKEVEKTVGNEISMKRNKNYHFFNRFDSVNRLAKSFEVVTEGEAQIILQEDDGFVAWLITKETLKNALLIVANYKAPTEKFNETDENGNQITVEKKGEDIFDKSITLPADYTVTCEHQFNGEDFEKQNCKVEDNTLHFDKLYPSQFKIFELQR